MTTSRVEFVEHDSEILKGNPLRDPHVRSFPVYVPRGYSRSRSYPVLYMLTGFSGQGEYYTYKRTFQQSLIDIYDELIEKKGLPPFICVMPTCLTYYGGSQYVNSSATGNYEDYVVRELVPFIDAKYSTSGQRAVAGGSSGGIGAFTLAARHPEIFHAVANHSGDSAFDYCYFMDVPKAVEYLEGFNGQVENFIERIHDPELPKDTGFMATINLLCMSACYLPNPKAHLGFDLFFDVRTGAIDEAVKQRLLAHDPVRFAAKYATNLKKLRYIHVDCGSRDQFHLHLGSRQLHAQLLELGVHHDYEEYKSDHFLLRKEQKKKTIPKLIKALL